jgi:hypothetical protein
LVKLLLGDGDILDLVRLEVGVGHVAQARELHPVVEPVGGTDDIERTGFGRKLGHERASDGRKKVASEVHTKVGSSGYYSHGETLFFFFRPFS